MGNGTASPPLRLSGMKPSPIRQDTHVPLKPARDAWVTQSQKWTLWFADAVQAGEGQITIKETSPRIGGTRVIADFNANATVSGLDYVYFGSEENKSDPDQHSFGSFSALRPCPKSGGLRAAAPSQNRKELKKFRNISKTSF